MWLSEPEKNQLSLSRGSHSCPACQGEQWKSARLVVLEGTSHTQGTVSGTLTDPGRLSGRLSDVLLSDRWFSFDHPIALETEGVTLTAFADSIKKVLVAEGRRIPEAVRPTDPPAPKRPAPAQRVTFFNKVRPGPLPTQPNPPEQPVLPNPPAERHWLLHWWKSVLGYLFTMLFFFFLGVFFLSDHLVEQVGQLFSGMIDPLIARSGLLSSGLSPKTLQRVAVALLLITPFGAIAFIRLPFKARKRNAVLADEHARKIGKINAGYADALKAFEHAKEKYRLAQQHYLLTTQKEVEQQAAAAKDADRYRRELENYEVELAAYSALVAKNKQTFAEEVGRVERARALLWDRVRICMRCGTGYLGP